jgi:cytochrome c oxidase subunit 3
MAGHTPTVDSNTLWGGGISPFNISYGKIMMWFFLVSDAFTFSGLLVSYGFMRRILASGRESFHTLSFHAW